MSRAFQGVLKAIKVRYMLSNALLGCSDAPGPALDSHLCHFSWETNQEQTSLEISDHMCVCAQLQPDAQWGRRTTNDEQTILLWAQAGWQRIAEVQQPFCTSLFVQSLLELCALSGALCVTQSDQILKSW